MIADGHHRYAAYLRLQHEHPGGPHDLGLAMLVDQDDTPLFMGAIHRVLAGTTLEDSRLAARAIGARFSSMPPTDAVAALGPRTLVATDGTHWAGIDLDVPRRRAVVELVHDRLIPALPRPPRRIDFHHSVEDALAHVSPEIGRGPAAARSGVRPGAADRAQPAGSSPRRPPPSSPSPASACSSARCATNEPATRHLHLDPGRDRPARPVEPAAHRTGHLDHVAGAPGGHRPAHPSRPHRALEGVDRLSRPPRSAAGHHDPKGPDRIAARQHPLLGCPGIRPTRRTSLTAATAAAFLVARVCADMHITSAAPPFARPPTSPAAGPRAVEKHARAAAGGRPVARRTAARNDPEIAAGPPRRGGPAQ